MGLKKAFEELTGLKFPPSLHEQKAWATATDEIRHERLLKQAQLFADAAAGRTENVRGLVAQGVTNSDRDKALRLTALEGRTETAIVLMTYGASARVRGEDGRNALDCALDAGHYETAAAIETSLQQRGPSPFPGQ